MNAAEKLVAIAKSGDLTDAREALQGLELELDRLRAALESLVGQDD